MTNNNLPKYWIVQNDGSQLFNDAVVKYLNRTYKQEWMGMYIDWYYGLDGSESYNGTNVRFKISYFKNSPTLLTLSQFIELSKPTTMSELPTKEQILEAAKVSCEIEKQLRILYPFAFEKKIDLRKLETMPMNNARIFTHESAKAAGFGSGVFLQIRKGGEYANRSFYVDSNHDAKIVTDSLGVTCILITPK